MTEQPRSGAQILADIKPTIRVGVAHICMRPDLIDEYHAANDALIEAQADDVGKSRLGTGGTSANTREKAEAVRAIEEQIEAADVAFTFHKIPKTRHSRICEEHPPREGNVLDFTVGYNREAVDDALVHESLSDPVFESCLKKGCAHDECGTWEALVKFLGPGEWEELALVVREINEAVTSAPKSPLASRILDKRGSASKRRAPGV